MKKIIVMILLMALMLCGMSAVSEHNWIDPENRGNFSKLLDTLVNAYERPSDQDNAVIDGALDAIRQVSDSDYEVARAIAAHWRAVYLDEAYQLYVHREGEKYAEALVETGLEDSDRHAIVVLGYELKNGEMTGELMGRCDAAAAAARSFPSAIIVCSGGATGDNNPGNHTEAGLMRDYLVEEHGIDPSRIHIDENAMTTLENAVNTLEILKRQGTETMTIVTSTYHQRWGQALYNAVSALYREAYGYSVEIEENYCYEIEPSKDVYRYDDRIAARQIAQLLGVPVDQ